VSGPVDVLAVMANAATFARAYTLPNSAEDYESAIAAVAELIEALQNSDEMLREFCSSNACFMEQLVANRAVLARVQS
jgi:hypothetical protein